MKKFFNQKVATIVFVCLGLINLLSLQFVPFFGRMNPSEQGYSSYSLLFGYGFPADSTAEILFPILVFALYTVLSLSMVILGLISLFSKKAMFMKAPVSSNKNLTFIISLILLIVSLVAIPAFYVNVHLNNQSMLYIDMWGYYEVGYGTYTIFPLNALISLAYILSVTLISNKKV